MNQTARFQNESETPEFLLERQEARRHVRTSELLSSSPGCAGRWIRSGREITLLDVYSRPEFSRRGDKRLQQEVESEVSFGDSFRKCMQSLGMPAPTSLFTSATQVQGTISVLVAAVEKFGARVTVAELVGAGVLSEAFLAVGALTTAAYAGACVGCLANALGQKLSGGISLADAWSYLRSEL